MAAPSQGPLAGTRVLDLTDEVAVNGTRLLAALGADVVRPEPPGGDALRQLPPFGPESSGQPLSLAHVTYNARKRSVTVEPGDGEAIRRLALASDAVVLSSSSPYAAAFEPDPRAFASAHPELSFVVVDPFPLDGPWAGAPVTNLTLAAAAGFAWLCGDPAASPEHPKGDMGFAYTGVSAAVAAMLGIAGRAYGRRAGWFELTAQESFAFATFQSADPNPLRWYGQIASRAEWGATARRALHRSKDGHWLTFVMLGAHFEDLADWFDRAGVSDAFHGPEWQDREYYIANAGQITDAIDDLCQRYDRDEVVGTGQGMRLMVMPVSTITDLLADPHLGERRMFETGALAGHPLRLPRAPALLSRTPLPPPRPAPQAGADTIEVLRDWSVPPARVANLEPGLPLTGMRVADFSWMLAAPIATRILADFGADVVRIETHARRDMTRETGPQPSGTFSLDTNSTQHHASSNKRSIALDFNKPGAVEVAREIIAKSDILFENYTPGTMARWGLEPEKVLAERPDLIYVSQPAVGATGPHRRWGAIGNGVAGYGGINMLTGYPENPPFGVGPIVSDFAAPMFTVAALLAAVEHRRKTGEGQYLDAGMLEATLWLHGTAWAETQLTGRNPERIGNRHPAMAPHGIFPCAGTDEWVAISARDDAEWRAAAKVLELASLGADARFATLEGRKTHEDLLEAAIAEATAGRDRWELAGALLAAGVPAAPVEHIGDHMERDAGTKNRRYAAVQHPYGHEFLVVNQFIRPGGRTVANRRAPMIGEQSDEILRGLLGKTDEAIAELTLRGVLH